MEEETKYINHIPIFTKIKPVRKNDFEWFKVEVVKIIIKSAK